MSRAIRTETDEHDGMRTLVVVERAILRGALYLTLAGSLSAMFGSPTHEASNTGAITAAVALAGLACSGRVRG